MSSYDEKNKEILVPNLPSDNSQIQNKENNTEIIRIA